MTYAKQSDVEVSMMRELTEAEAQYVEPLLERAERLISVRVPDLADRVAANPKLSLVVADIEAEAVARVLRAPEGGIMRQEGEGNYSYSLNLQVASGLLDILDGEWERLGVSRLRSVMPETDGYARSRYGRPDLNFQYGWPARDLHSPEWEGPPTWA